MAAKVLQLLNYLIHHRDRVVPAKRFCTRCENTTGEVSSRTIEVHVTWLRQTLDNPQSLRFIQTVRGKASRFTYPA